MKANNVYFVGIGGIGMAAIARYYISPASMWQDTTALPQR